MTLLDYLFNRENKYWCLNSKDKQKNGSTKKRQYEIMKYFFNMVYHDYDH